MMTRLDDEAITGIKYERFEDWETKEWKDQRIGKSEEWGMIEYILVIHMWLQSRLKIMITTILKIMKVISMKDTMDIPIRTPNRPPRLETSLDNWNKSLCLLFLTIYLKDTEMVLWYCTSFFVFFAEL